MPFGFENEYGSDLVYIEFLVLVYHFLALISFSNN